MQRGFIHNTSLLTLGCLLVCGVFVLQIHTCENKTVPKLIGNFCAAEQAHSPTHQTPPLNTVVTPDLHRLNNLMPVFLIVSILVITQQVFLPQRVFARGNPMRLGRYGPLARAFHPTLFATHGW